MSENQATSPPQSREQSPKVFVNRDTSPIIYNPRTYAIKKAVGKFINKYKLHALIGSMGIAAGYSLARGAYNAYKDAVDTGKKLGAGTINGAKEVINGVANGIKAFKDSFSNSSQVNATKPSNITQPINGTTPCNSTIANCSSIHQRTERPKNTVGQN